MTNNPSLNLLQLLTMFETDTVNQPKGIDPKKNCLWTNFPEIRYLYVNWTGKLLCLRNFLDAYLSF